VEIGDIIMPDKLTELQEAHNLLLRVITYQYGFDIHDDIQAYLLKCGIDKNLVGDRLKGNTE
jgi:RNA-binding protein YlmH